MSKKVRVIIFPFILSRFSFVSNATNFVHSLSRFVLIKAAYMLLVFFKRVPFSFLVYANIPFKWLYTGLRKKLFWFLCRINSSQNQNTNEHNFNLIWDEGHILIRQILIYMCDLHLYTSKRICACVGACACDSTPRLKGSVIGSSL